MNAVDEMSKKCATKNIVVTAKITEADAERLVSACKRSGLSKSKVMRLALLDLLDSCESAE